MCFSILLAIGNIHTNPLERSHKTPKMHSKCPHQIIIASRPSSFLLITTIATIITIGLLDHTAAQVDGIIPDDVELINNAEGATGKLAMPFNNHGYQPSYPVVLLDPQLVRPRSHFVTLLRIARSKMASKVITTCTNLLQQRPAFRASATLVGDNAEAGPMGTVTFTQHPLGNPLLVTMNATGLPPGKHAVHIHAYGDLREGCKSTGPHLRHILVRKRCLKSGKPKNNVYSFCRLETSR